MRIRHWEWIILASVSTAAVSAHAMAQTIRIDANKPQILETLTAPEGADMLEFFTQLGKRSPATDLTGKLKDFPPGTLSELQKQLRDNPAMAETIKKAVESSPKLSPDVQKSIKDLNLKQFQDLVSPESLNELRKALPGAGKLPGNQPGLDKEKLMKNLIQAKPYIGGVPGRGSETSTEQRPGRATPLPPRPAETPRPNSKIGRGIMDWAKKMERLDPSLAKSPTLQKVIRELSKHLGEDDPRWQKLADNASTVQEKFARLSQTLQLQRLLPKDGLSWPRGLTPLHLGNASHRDRTVEPADGLAGSGSGPIGANSRGLQAILTGVVLGVIAVVAWSLLFKARRAEETDEHARGRLRPWPVEPSTVATRADLIRAFEHLSLLRLGSPARNWNHEVIAQQLGEDSIGSASAPPVMTWDPLERRHAADELARLYERARYAPSQEALPEEALAAARRDLCFLAGMPA